MSADRLGAALLLVLLVAAPWIATGPVAAHGSELGLVHVPLDHVMPGETFPVIVSDMEPGAEVTLAIAVGGTSLTIGTAQLDAQGNVSASVLLPVSVPHGYGLLTATQPNGDHASTTVLVGPRAEGPNQDVGTPDRWFAAAVVLAAGAAVLATVFLPRLARRARRS